MDSDRESDEGDFEVDKQRTHEQAIEHQLDEFLYKWKKEIQQRTVYGHVINDKQREEQQHQQELLNEEEQAAEFFQRACELEREGKLYDAIKYYRAAMQLVPDIEFRMARKCQQPITTMESNNQQENISQTNNIADTLEPNDNLIDSLQRIHLEDGEISTICMKNFPQQSTHISCLPSELLIYIFRWVVSSDLDVRSLEQCARVCRGFYLCARDPQLWKMICFKIWGVNAGNLSATINWRHMFINRPHVVFNGVYISRATYIRQGEQSLDRFYAPWHLVEYYRYMRFFPDGVVFIYTSADEPRATVARLKCRYSMRDPALICGNYRLQNNRVLVVAKRIAQRSQGMTSSQKRSGKDVQASEIEQTMHMNFEVCDVGKKRHHQLIWVHYEIKFNNKRTGEERSTVLDVTDDRHTYPPLIFSRVKSFTLAAEQLLK